MKKCLFCCAAIVLFAACKNQNAAGANERAEAASEVLANSKSAAATATALAESAPETTPARPPESPAPAIELDYLMGKFSPEKRNDFVAVGKPYSDREGMFLRREAFEKFKEMFEAAKAEGVSLKIISSTRTFWQQKNIWETKWANLAKAHPDPAERARKILEFSSMPGTSRHHWGTDIDLNDLRNETFAPGGRQEKTYAWLAKHAHEFGFCQPYTPKGDARPNGYNEEKWHWSFMPIAKHMLDACLAQLTDDLISGFKGSETAKTIGAVKNYAGGINPDCK